MQLDPISSLQIGQWFAGPAPVIHLKYPQAYTPLGVLPLQIGQPGQPTVTVDGTTSHSADHASLAADDHVALPGQAGVLFVNIGRGAIVDEVALV